ncbi:MAG: DUF4097 family beta strand repeat protein [Eubacterium sp.]|nr:DUF4097 family beta strand repeat protein [Eubacterium sp.]
MTKNNRGLIITVIILLVIIILLLTGLMVFVIASNGFENIEISNNSISLDEKYDSSEIDRLIVNTTGGEITVKKSEDNNIRITAHGGREKNFNVSSNDGAISIEYFEQRINFLGNMRLPDIDIYLPEKVFESIEITSNIGDITLEGEIDTNLKISCDVGDIKADSLYGSFDIHTDCGDIEIDNISIIKNSSADTNLGNIEIEHTNDIRIDYKTSLGECDIKNNNTESDIVLTAKTNLGDIEINN